MLPISKIVACFSEAQRLRVKQANTKSSLGIRICRPVRVVLL